MNVVRESLSFVPIEIGRNDDHLKIPFGPTIPAGTVLNGSGSLTVLSALLAKYSGESGTVGLAIYPVQGTGSGPETLAVPMAATALASVASPGAYALSFAPCVLHADGRMVLAADLFVLNGGRVSVQLD